MEFCIFEKFNNSIATKLCADLLNNRKKINRIICSAQYNSRTTVCRALFKCEIKQKLVEKNNAQLWSALK